jgi:hypothetical protein
MHQSQTWHAEHPEKYKSRFVQWCPDIHFHRTACAHQKALVKSQIPGSIGREAVALYQNNSQLLALSQAPVKGVQPSLVQ